MNPYSTKEKNPNCLKPEYLPYLIEIQAFRHEGLMLPTNYHKQVVEYVLDGIRTDNFVKAVFSNDLIDAVQLADEGNLRALRAWVAFMEEGMPVHASGSPEVYEAWMGKGGLLGIARRKAELTPI